MDATSISSPVKKRKNKDDDRQSSKKRKHHEASSPKQKKSDKHHRKHKDTAESARPVSPSSSRKPLSKPVASQLSSPELQDSPFHLVNTTLYLPLSPISISPTHALPSLLSEHIAPLLLTYYPPLRGIILAFSNPSISSTPPQSPSNSPQNQTLPQPLTLAVTAGEYGVLYVYLTITFLVFRPERGQTLEGWINVQSEGFLGAVVLNLFSVGIERKRLPRDWKWIAPGQSPPPSELEQQQTQTGHTDEEESDVDSDKENFRPLKGDKHIPDSNEDELSAATGYFQTRSGKRVRGTINFRVKDVDVIPGSERDKGFLSLEGTMLSLEEETNLVNEEKTRVMGPQEGVVESQRGDDDVVMVSGGLVSEAMEAEPTAKTSGKDRKKKKKSKE